MHVAEIFSVNIFRMMSGMVPTKQGRPLNRPMALGIMPDEVNIDAVRKTGWQGQHVIHPGIFLVFV